MSAGLFVLAGYFLPFIIAVMRSHHNKVAIFVLNLFTGWTVIFWIVALVWSFTSPPPSVNYVRIDRDLR